jgi:hypothetical protein
MQFDEAVRARRIRPHQSARIAPRRDTTGNRMVASHQDLRVDRVTTAAYRQFDLDGVRITWPNALAQALLARGPLDDQARDELTRRLAHSFPAYTAGERASPG